MKTIMRITSLIILVLAGYFGKAQNIAICQGNSATLTANNNLNLSSPSYSINPGGVTASVPNFVVSPGSSTTFTLYTTGTFTNSSVMTSSNVVTVQVNALPVISVSPATQSISCGAGIAALITCTASTPMNNVLQQWYGPASTVAASSNGQVSTYGPSVISGTATTYTCVVTDTLTGCSTSGTAQVTSSGFSYFPSFSVSISNFYASCTPTPFCYYYITNVNTVPPGGVITNTILAPGFVGSYSTGLYPPAQNTINTPGTYTVIVKDNANLCEARVPLTIGQGAYQTTVAPGISISAATRTLTCFTPSVALQGISLDPNVAYNWQTTTAPSLSTNSVLTVFTTSAGATVPSATVLNTYTLTVTDINTTCSSSSVITIYQNIRPPMTGIALTNTILSCPSNTINATNSSTTGVLPATFFATLGINSVLWQGPSPQVPASNVSTYLISTPGVYTMTAMDMNNGCTSTQTVQIAGALLAAFVHTTSSGTATFNDASSGTNSNTNYYWDFGDGFFSTQQNPSHTYASGGAYPVKLKISQPSTNCADSVIQSVNISGLPCSPNANFGLVPTSTPQLWNAVPAYPWNVSAASWSWGDGSFSNTLYASHQYSAAAMYNICLSVTVNCVGTASSCSSYSVYRSSQPSLIYQVNVVAPELSSGLTQTHIEEQNNLTIYPNPNSGDFYLSIDKLASAPLRVVISDLTGRIVFDEIKVPADSGFSIRAGNLSPGLYLVSVEGETTKITKRMVVSR